MTMQTYGQIVQSYAQKPCQLMGEPPRISSMKSMEGVQRYDHTYKLVGFPIALRIPHSFAESAHSSAVHVLSPGARYFEVRLLLENNELSNGRNIAWERFTRN